MSPRVHSRLALLALLAAACTAGTPDTWLGTIDTLSSGAMPFWLVLFLVAVSALLLRELFLLLGQRTGRVLDLTPADERAQRRIVGLRLLAFVALALALGQRTAYRLGWRHRAVDFLTGVFLAIAVALIVAAWYLRRKHDM